MDKTPKGFLHAAVVEPFDFVFVLFVFYMFLMFIAESLQYVAISLQFRWQLWPAPGSSG